MTKEEIEQAAEETFKRIRDDASSYFNTLVLSQSYTVVRLVNVIDGEDDFYYIMDDWGKVLWDSCVGRFFPLKAHLKDEDYNELVRVWNLNNTEKIESI